MSKVLDFGEPWKKYAIAFGFVATFMALRSAPHTSDDPLTLGPMIAVALASPLYGLIIGFSLADPIADYLENKQEESSTPQDV